MAMVKLNKDAICCIVVTFNPDILLLGLIACIENQVDKIIIVDNNSEVSGLDVLSKLNTENISIIYNEDNYGIAKALNQGVSLARELKYDWVITFDQDSKPFSNIIQILSNVYETYPNKQEIGAIGINFLKANGVKYYRALSDDVYFEKDYLITSGCLLSVESFNLIGGFREDLFIDNVDLEYSLRLRRYGKKLLISGECGMTHDPGSPKSLKFHGIYIATSNHNSDRRYYMARNHILLCKSYFCREPYFIAKTTYFFITSLIKMVIVEEDKISKITSSINGIIDGLFYPPNRERHLNQGIN